ncbi:MAG TPA: signal peptidase I [Candidatus Bathyarchaeia archaeon]|nr:signal peptidase I [Candidatus Bathyarchaeia archaeon]
MWLLIRNILFLPFVLIGDVCRSPRLLARKIGYVLLIFVLFGISWYGGYRAAIRLIKLTFFELGLADRLSEVDVSGESMLPAIKDGDAVQLHSVKKYGISRGDIVSFKNLETANLYYLKRVVGLPGERISIKNGFVTINGHILEEDYVLNQLPTFGNTFLAECNRYTVPPDHYLVLGDNRTVSLDSRVVGFIDKGDIEGVIKSQTKERFVTSQRQRQILRTNIETELLLEKINLMRSEHGISPLMINDLLSEVSKSRVGSINEHFDSWKEQSVSVEKLLQDKGYQYNLVHEFITFGYLDEETIIKQILESSADESAFLSSNFVEIGLGTVEITNLDCSFPIIDLIIGWPSVPTYGQEVIDFWNQQATDSAELLNFLQSFVGASGYDQSQLRELVSAVAESYQIASQMKQIITRGEWLDYEQADRYYQLVEENDPKLEAFFAKLEVSLPNIPLLKNTPTPGLSQNQQPVTSNEFFSFGQKMIEKNAAANINLAWKEGEKIKIKVTFANVSADEVAIFPVRLSLKSQTQGTAPEPALTNLVLKAGEVRGFELAYDKIGYPPYKWSYLSSTGEEIELGTYYP